LNHMTFVTIMSSIFRIIRTHLRRSKKNKKRRPLCVKLGCASHRQDSTHSLAKDRAELETSSGCIARVRCAGEGRMEQGRGSATRRGGVLARRFLHT
jgi:hypothetical protein